MFLLKSTDGGQSFGGPVNLSVGIPNSVSIHPNIDVSDNNVAITWELRFPSSANPHWEVFFVGSTDAGNTFSDPISISSSLGNRDSTLNDVAISGTNVYSTWTTFENVALTYTLQRVTWALLNQGYQHHHPLSQ